MYKYYREKLHVNHLWELKGEKILSEHKRHLTAIEKSLSKNKDNGKKNI